MESKFQFLEEKYSKLYLISKTAEILSSIDTSSCLSKCRLFIEEMVDLLSSFENITYPDRTILSDKLFELNTEKIIPDGAIKRFYSIRDKGNKGAHNHYNLLDTRLCHDTLKECYQLAIWFIYTYEKEYIEDRKYENLNSAELTVSDQITNDKQEIENSTLVEKLEEDIENAPSFVGSLELKIKEMSEDYEELKRRRKRSNKIDKIFAISSILGLGLGTTGALALGVTPVGISVGLAGGLGYLAFKYREDRKDKD